MTLVLLLGCGPADTNTPPEVSISDPNNRADFRAGEPFTVTGEINDADGPNSLDVAWEIDPPPADPGNSFRGDGEVSLFLESGIEEIGAYTISLTATDVAGLSTTDQIDVDILENAAPSVKLKEPNNDFVYDYGVPLIVEVQIDAKDDEMSQITLTWGGVAEGAPDAPDRAPDDGLVIFYVEDVAKGQQVVTVTASDSGGQADTETVSFRVK